MTSFGDTFPLGLNADAQIKKARPRTQLKTQSSPVSEWPETGGHEQIITCQLVLF